MLSSREAMDDPEGAQLRVINRGETIKAKQIAAVGMSTHSSNLPAVELDRANTGERIDGAGIVLSSACSLIDGRASGAGLPTRCCITLAL